MIEDADDDKRRARRSREILSGMMDVSFAEFQAAAFDTTVYWAKHRLPEYAQHLEVLKTTNPKLAADVATNLEHLLEWDCRVTGDSTAASLCEAWYEALYGSDYPGETMKEPFEGRPERQLEALVQAAKALCLMHGHWKVPYGEIHRVQRQPWVADLMELRFQDDQPSLPCTAAHGPMGVVFTQYYTPSIVIPLVISQKKRYGLVGATYLAVYEFNADRVRGASLLQFGTSGDPKSAHYFDQAQLLSEARLKPIPFTQAEVRDTAVRSYHPGK
jgi:acyl-homoserine lactone acylase PvdQ